MLLWMQVLLLDWRIGGTSQNTYRSYKPIYPFANLLSLLAFSRNQNNPGLGIICRSTGGAISQPIR